MFSEYGHRHLLGLRVDFKMDMRVVAVNCISPEKYRAIQPAEWWTKKALERVARKIEFAQGLEIERSGRYDVDDNGNIIEKNARKSTEVSQTARDIEAHTGEQSSERIAKKETTSILQTEVSWNNLLAIKIRNIEFNH